MTTEGKKRGRPPKAPSERKRGNVTVRVRDRLYEKLTNEAANAQRSLSEEIERELEAYYEQKEAYGELARFVGSAVKMIEKKAGRPWYADDEMRLSTRAAIDAVLDLLVCDPFKEHEIVQLTDDVISWFAYKVGGEDAPEPGQAPPSEPDLDYAHVQIRRGLKYNESFIKAVQLLQGQKDKMSPEALAHFTSPSDEAALPEGNANSIKPRK